jgi:hypothetical protein
VGREVLGHPALAERRGVRPEVTEEVAQLSSLPGVEGFGHDR